jgi:hypothetical protein
LSESDPVVVGDDVETAAVAFIVELSVADPVRWGMEYGLTAERMVEMAQEFLKTWGLR